MKTCHVPWCDTPCVRKDSFCPAHFAMLPKALKELLHRYYLRGQEYDLVETRPEYFEALHACVDWLKTRLGGECSNLRRVTR
jgi:hypothetical protein